MYRRGVTNCDGAIRKKVASIITIHRSLFLLTAMHVLCVVHGGKIFAMGQSHEIFDHRIILGTLAWVPTSGSWATKRSFDYGDNF
jgi:hypothetical protein